MTDADIIEAILRREGGWVSHLVDRGGPTNWGITLPTLQGWRGKYATIEDLKALTRDEAKAIYEGLYIKIPGLDRIQNMPLRALLVDSAVNHGPRRAVKMLQKAVGTIEDGIMGPKTLEAIKSVGTASLELRVAAERVRYYGKIISSDHSQAAFAAGWLNRATEFLDDLATRLTAR